MKFTLILLLILPLIYCKMTSIFNMKPTKLINYWWKTPQQVLIASSNNTLVEYFTNIPQIAINEENLGKELIKLKSSKKPSGYTILPESLETLDSDLMTITESETFQIAKYTVAIPQGISAQSVAEVLWNYKFPDAIIIQIEITEIKMYKIDIVECSIARAILYEPSNKEKPNIFNFKASFIGCPFRIIWNHHAPYVYPLNQTYGWKGIFVDFIEPLSYLSQRPLIYAPDDEEYFWEMARSYSYNAVMEDLVNDTLLFVGSVLSASNVIFHVSTILVEDDIVVLVPRSLTNAWKHFGDAVSTQRIIFSLGTLLIVTMVLFLLYKRDYSFIKILLDLFGVLLEARGFGRAPHYWNLRIFIGLLLLLSMVINFFIQGSLMSILTGPMYEPPLKNIQQLLDSKWTIRGNKLITTYLELLAKTDPEMVEVLRRNVPIDANMEILLEKVTKEKNFATWMVSALLLTKRNIDKVFGHFPFIHMNLGLAMKKYQYSSPHIDGWIYRLVESGFLEKFKRLHLNQLALKRGVEIDEKKFVITLKEFWPALLFLVFGHAIAIGVFFVELAYKKFRKYLSKYKKCSF